uniref:Uncharacterized protein n=1 Tax=Acrobeloides nanus TaxID=290746 RepID=A0A914CVM1_9BILA
MPEDKNMCIDIDTNLMLGSAAYAFRISPISNFVLKDVDFGDHEYFFSCSCEYQQCFTTFFPELKDKCSEGKKILIDVDSKIFKLTFDDKGSPYVLAKGTGEFKIYPKEDDDFKQSETLLVIEAFVGIQLDEGKVNVTNWKTYAQIKIFNKNLTATSKFIPQISNVTIETLWDQILQDIATKSANDLIRSGLPLPRAYFTRISNVYPFVYSRTIGPFITINEVMRRGISMQTNGNT